MLKLSVVQAIKSKPQKYLFNQYRTFNDGLKKEKITFDKDSFKIKINEKNIKKFPYIWLRDCCSCKHCFDSKNHQHLIDLKSIPESIKPVLAPILSENSSHFEVFCKHSF